MLFLVLTKTIFFDINRFLLCNEFLSVGSIIVLTSKVKIKTVSDPFKCKDYIYPDFSSNLLKV